MKAKHQLLIVAVMLFFVSLPAFSQDPIMRFDHKEIGSHERPIVQFNHEKHSATIDCLQCHHDYDSFGNNRGGEGQQCAACHNAKTKDRILPLTEAFHTQCKSCHANMRQMGRAAGPVTCGKCHKK
jgi:hypothetical protein